MHHRHHNKRLGSVLAIPYCSTVTSVVFAMYAIFATWVCYGGVPHPLVSDVDDKLAPIDSQNDVYAACTAVFPRLLN